ncbi:MAG TPA: DUF6152 family protein [Rhodospirillales bacterium]|nr:DUF6152 family protein [Rhodospirillales bacterium]
MIASRRMFGAAAGLALLFAAGTAAAHHGWSSYDADRPLTVNGTIERVAYDNPHVAVFVAAADRTWEVILAPISRMQARGADAAVVAVGKTIEAYGYPSREHDGEIRAERISIDGRTYELR